MAVAIAAGMAGATRFMTLLSVLLRSGAARKATVVAGGGSIVADVLNLDFFRQQAFQAAPNSTPAALESAARLALELLGSPNTIWEQNATRDGVANCRFLHLNLQNGNVWLTTGARGTYRQMQRTRSSRRFGRRAYGAGRRDMAQTVTAARS